MKTSNAVSPFAEALRQARLRQGRLVEDVAQACLLSENQILGIEADDYHSFYTSFFAKQATKRYAELMGVSLDLLGSPWHGSITPAAHLSTPSSAPSTSLEAKPSSAGEPAMPAEVAPTSEGATDQDANPVAVVPTQLLHAHPTSAHATIHGAAEPNGVESESVRRAWLRPLAAGLLVGVVIGGGYIFFINQNNAAPSVAPSAVTPVAADGESMAIDARTDAPTGTDPSSAGSTPSPVAAVAANAGGGTPVPAADGQNAPVGEASANRFATLNMTPEVPDDPRFRFFFKVHGRVDLKVTDATGKVLINQNAMADGDSARVIGKPPFKLEVSDGDAIEVYYMTRRIHPSINALGKYEAVLADAPTNGT